MIHHDERSRLGVIPHARGMAFWIRFIRYKEFFLISFRQRLGGAFMFSLALASSIQAEAGLTDLPMEELLKTEISLDDAFDIFGAVVSTPKVSVATGKCQDAFLAPAVTSVITAQDLEAIGARTLSEALRSVPGLYVRRDQVYQPEFAVRGVNRANNSDMLVLINGEPFKGLESGNRGIGWRDMPVNGIARIEVIRGPGSAVHGADAFSGTINIITKTARDIGGTEVGARLGSFNTSETWLLHGRRYGDYEIAAMLELLDTDGQDTVVPADTQSFLDQMTGTQASLAPSSVNARERSADARLDITHHNWRWRAAYQGRFDVGTGVGASGALDDWGDINRNRFSLDAIYHNRLLTPNWNVSAQLNYVYDENNIHFGIYPPGMGGILDLGGQAVPFVYPDGMRLKLVTKEEHIHAGLSGFYAGLKDHLIRVGVGIRYEDLFEVGYHSNNGLDATGNPIMPGSPMLDLSDTPAAIYPEAQRINYYAFIQDSWHLAPNWDFTWGVRHDDYSDFGGTTNPRAALVWQTTPRLTAKLLYGRAFRAPSFRDLYTANNQVFIGNPNLEPETSETLELAFNWRAYDKLNVSLNLFHLKLKDMIRGVDTPAYNIQTVMNEGELKSHGAEFELRWKLSRRASLLFNHAWSDVAQHVSVGRETLSDTTFIPMQQAYARVDTLLWPKWYLNTQLIWLSEQKRETLDDSRPPVSSSFSTDLTLRYKNIGHSKWNAAFGIRNVFDEKLRYHSYLPLPDDFPQAGRTFFAEFRYLFDK